MFKRSLILLIILLVVGLLVSGQDSDPEATPEVTAEVTVEVTAEVTPEATPEATAAPDDSEIGTEEDPNCPALVDTALNLTQDRCEGTGLNEACYGYVMIESQSRSGGTALEQPGDIVPLIDIQTLQLSSLDTSTGQWGVLELKVEANVQTDPTEENTVPTTALQDLQFVVFGDTQIQDAGQFVQVVSNGVTPVHRFPNEDSEVLEELEDGFSTLASARLVGDEWVRIPVDLVGGDTVFGWLPVASLTFEDDLAILPEVSEEDANDPEASTLTSQFGPMQAFIFESGVDDAPCSAAPNSGMLIQTPEGVASVTVVMDEVVIQMSGTGFVQAQPNGEIRLDVLDGEASVTAEGDTRTAVEGQSVSVDLDENGLPAGVPNDPEPLDLNNTQGLPTNLLDDEVTIPEPLADGVPVNGDWSLTFNVSSLSCPDGSEWPFGSAGNVRIQAQQDGLIYGGNFHRAIGPTTYQGSYSTTTQDVYTNTLEVAASDRMSGTTNIEFNDRLCTLSVPFSLQLVNPS